jgi:hypothetical protein
MRFTERKSQRLINAYRFVAIPSVGAMRAQFPLLLAAALMISTNGVRADVVRNRILPMEPQQRDNLGAVEGPRTRHRCATTWSCVSGPMLKRHHPSQSHIQMFPAGRAHAFEFVSSRGP